MLLKVEDAAKGVGVEPQLIRDAIEAGKLDATLGDDGDDVLVCGAQVLLWYKAGCDVANDSAADLSRSQVTAHSHVAENMGFCLGNVVKYAVLADMSKESIWELKIAQWYLEREFLRRTRDTDDTGS